jgi:hypothetical protein
MKSSKERQEIFMEWTTFTIDRVNEWKKNIPTELANKLDWSPESLTFIEKYALENYTIKDQKDKSKRAVLDAIVSYIGEVFRINIPETIWKIELDNQTNIYYNLPYLVFKLGVPTCPHILLQDVLTDKTGIVLTERFNQRLKKWQQYKAYIDSQK